MAKGVSECRGEEGGGFLLDVAVGVEKVGIH